MKSLNKLGVFSRISENFSPYLTNFLETEGFTEHNNDSYCFVEFMNENSYVDWEEKCLYKHIEGNSYGLNVYIFKAGIGLDIDYDCGGNSSNHFWEFKDPDNIIDEEFETLYDHMVDKVQRYI